MAAQTRGQLSQLHDNTDRKIYVMYQKQLKELPDIWKRVTQVKQSNRQTEISLPIVGFGDIPEKPEGNAFSTDVLMAGHQKTVTHTEFGAAFEVTQTALEDDLHDQLTKAPMWLMFSAGYTMEKRAANLYNNGFTTELAADGLSAFNTAHTLIRGGTFRNRPSAEVDLSWTALKDAITDLSTETKHDSGQLALAVQDLILYVPPALEMLADRIVNSTGLPGVADNDRNAIKSRRNIEIVTNPLLTDTDAWFLVAKNKDLHGFCAYERVALTQMSPENDPRSRSRLYPIRFRYSWFVNQPQNSWGTQGA
jgi:hypothetical protein|tara:strand:- start:2034 stop:2957 length:924 start_codon:yes stop_codon:yes gene_type:complete